MDELKLRRDMERADKAAKLLEDPLLTEAFETVEKQILRMFSSAKLGDERSIIKAKDLEYALSLVRRALEQVLRDGKLAAQTLEEKRRNIPFLGDVWKPRSRRSNPFP